MLSFLYGPLLTNLHDYWKNHSFDYMDLCWQSDVSIFNMLSSFVIGFLLRSRQSPSTVICRAQKKICHCFHFFSIYFLWSGVIRCHDLSVFNVELQANFSLSSFIHIKRLFSFSLLSAIRVVSSGYLRLLIFLPAILIPPCDSFSSAFHMMYSAYKLNK